MQTNLIGQFIKVSWTEPFVYNDIVAVYVYHGEMHLIARNPEGLLGDYVATSSVVVPEKPE